MGNKTNIAWCESTWNCLRGCSKVSSGCTNCYAEKMAARFCSPPSMGRIAGPYHGVVKNGRWNGKVKLISEKLDQPLRWTKPRKIFVNSMSDLFHEEVSFETIAAIFGVMAASRRHTFQVLTKRPERMLEFLTWAEKKALGDMPAFLRHHLSTRIQDKKVERLVTDWPLPNVHLGVSAEDQSAADERIPLLMQCPASVRWVSIEPQIGPIDMSKVPTLNRMGNVLPDWIVVGGESGPGARPFDIGWARNLVEQCKHADVRIFVKQMGSNPCEHGDSAEAEPTRLNLKHRAGADPEEWPEDLRVRQWPRREGSW